MHTRCHERTPDNPGAEPSRAGDTMERADRHRGRGLRVAGGVCTTAAGVAALLTIWLLPTAVPEEDRVAGWVGAFVASVAVFNGVLLLIGWSNGRRMSLTRARWRY